MVAETGTAFPTSLFFRVLLEDWLVRGKMPYLDIAVTLSTGAEPRPATVILVDLDFVQQIGEAKELQDVPDIIVPLMRVALSELWADGLDRCIRAAVDSPCDDYATLPSLSIAARWAGGGFEVSRVLVPRDTANPPGCPECKVLLGHALTCARHPANICAPPMCVCGLPHHGICYVRSSPFDFMTREDVAALRRVSHGYSFLCPGCGGTEYHPLGVQCVQSLQAHALVQPAAEVAVAVEVPSVEELAAQEAAEPLAEAPPPAPVAAQPPSAEAPPVEASAAEAAPAPAPAEEGVEEQLRAEIEQLAAENADLRKELVRLRAENMRLKRGLGRSGWE